MTRDQIIKAINSVADQAVIKMNRSLPGAQNRLLLEVQDLVRQLDYKDKRISPTVKNLKALNTIQNKMRGIILSTGYEQDVREFLKSFSEITTLQNLYLKQTVKNFKIKSVFKQIKQQSVQSTIISLTEAGLDANVIGPVTDVLRTNITTGGTFNQLMEQVGEAITNTKAGGGRLQRYVKQITNDSLNQYSRNYLQLATQGTGLEWYQYTGSNIKTTRCFCHAMTKKRYFHVSEILKLIAGDFEEYKEMKCTEDPKTGLPQGMIPGTNVSNFLVNLGGYNCGHRAIPVLTALVPVAIRNKIKTPTGEQAGGEHLNVTHHLFIFGA